MADLLLGSYVQKRMGDPHLSNLETELYSCGWADMYPLDKRLNFPFVPVRECCSYSEARQRYLENAPRYTMVYDKASRTIRELHTGTAVLQHAWKYVIHLSRVNR